MSQHRKGITRCGVTSNETPVGAELERLCAERGNWLMATAIALTGDRADAEDLLQTALERLLRHRRGHR